jgi:hypothetical protein
MQKRMIHDRIWQSESISTLDWFGRLLWIGVITVADDQGRLRGNPTVLRSLIFPFDDVPVKQVEATIERLVALGCLLPYDVAGKQYLQIVNWWQYQDLQWARPSEYPPPEGWCDHVRIMKKGRYIDQNWSTRSESKVGKVTSSPDSSPESSRWTDSDRASDKDKHRDRFLDGGTPSNEDEACSANPASAPAARPPFSSSDGVSLLDCTGYTAKVPSADVNSDSLSMRDGRDCIVPPSPVERVCSGIDVIGQTDDSDRALSESLTPTNRAGVDVKRAGKHRTARATSASGADVAETKGNRNAVIHALAEALAQVCCMDIGANEGRLHKEAKLLAQAGLEATPALVGQHYGGPKGGPAWWWQEDWRGRKGQFPKPCDVRETWGAWREPPAVPTDSRSSVEKLSPLLAAVARSKKSRGGLCGDAR